MDQRIFRRVNIGLLAGLAARFIFNLTASAAILQLPRVLDVLAAFLAFLASAGAPALGGYIAARTRRSSALREAQWVGIAMFVVGALASLFTGNGDLGWELVISASITIPAALLGGYLAIAGLTSAST